MTNLDNAQKEFLLKFFELPHLSGWKNIATKLLENESCIVAGTDKIWIGGIGNFIKTKSGDILIDCLEYTFELEQFLSSLNSTGKKWNLKNYANAWAKLGNENYIKLLDFAKKEKLPLNPLIIAFDGEKGGNGNMNFKDGKFEFKYTARLKEVFRIYNHAIDLGLERSQQSFNGFVRVYSCNYFKEKKFYRCVEVKCAGTKGIRNRDVYYNIFSEYLQK